MIPLTIKNNLQQFFGMKFDCLNLQVSEILKIFIFNFSDVKRKWDILNFRLFISL